MLVTQQNIVETAKQCRGVVRASDADGTHGALFIQVDALYEKLGRGRSARAYIGDMIVPSGETFRVIRASEIAA